MGYFLLWLLLMLWELAGEFLSILPFLVAAVLLGVLLEYGRRRKAKCLDGTRLDGEAGYRRAQEELDRIWPPDNVDRGPMDYPPAEMARLVRRIEEHALPGDHRSWVGNDESQRNHNGRIPEGENPVYLRLCWRASKGALVEPVGGFVINVVGLMREGYLAEDPAGGVRLKFLHAEDGTVYVGRGFTKKKIPVGRV